MTVSLFDKSYSWCFCECIYQWWLVVILDCSAAQRDWSQAWLIQMVIKAWLSGSTGFVSLRCVWQEISQFSFTPNGPFTDRILKPVFSASSLIFNPRFCKLTYRTHEPGNGQGLLLCDVMRHIHQGGLVRKAFLSTLLCTIISPFEHSLITNRKIVKALRVEIKSPFNQIVHLSGRVAVSVDIGND